MNKELLYAHLLSIMQEREQELNRNWQELMESNQQEGKSSAGDKHETSAAMVHLELEQMAKQRSEFQKQQEELLRFKPKDNASSGVVRMGSLVQTNLGWYYLITSMGNVGWDDEVVFVLSGLSPLGSSLMGKKVGDEIFRDGKNIPILVVL
jgi:transcription elongation GreA/GreB family factor